MSLLQHYINTFRKGYATFKGRANRKEYAGGFILVYFMLQLFTVIVSCIAYAKLSKAQKVAILNFDMDGLAEIPKMVLLGLVLLLLLILLHLLPMLSLAVRRGHDIGISAWWVVPLSVLAPGHILLTLLPGKPDPNKYGSPPAKNDALTPASYLLVGVLSTYWHLLLALLIII